MCESITKKQIIILLLTFFSFNCYSQIIFEKGYYIDNSNKKVECLINNLDWKNNPTSFEYKLAENSELKTLTIKNIIEFGIYNYSKYTKYVVGIDVSQDITGELSDIKTPIFKEKEVFLKTLVQGKSNLLYFEDGNLRRFFLKNENSKVEQLIYKRYNLTDNLISTNSRYKQQLANNLNCESLTIKDFENLRYKKNDLIKIFVKYNECSDGEFTNYTKNQEKGKFHLRIKPGLNSSSLKAETLLSRPSRQFDFGNSLGFRLGLEAEFILPFNKNKWAVLLEPNYQYFKSEKERQNRTSIQDLEVNYKSIELAFGVRHYLFLNEKSKIFINGSVVIDMTLDLQISFWSDPEPGNNLAFGLGYEYNKYSFELRHFTNRNLINNYKDSSTDYKNLSLIFGFKFL